MADADELDRQADQERERSEAHNEHEEQLHRQADEEREAQEREGSAHKD